MLKDFLLLWLDDAEKVDDIISSDGWVEIPASRLGELLEMWEPQQGVPMKEYTELAGMYHMVAPNRPPENFRGCTHPDCEKHKVVIERRPTQYALDGAFCACLIFIPSYESTVAKCRICGKPPRQ